MKRLFLIPVSIVFFWITIAGNVYAVRKATDTGDVPVKGIVNVINFGTELCLPCRMMVPVIEKMKKQYEGEALIAFVDLRENLHYLEGFNILLIPTQVFFDSDGREIYRHVGFMPEEDIAAQLEKMGIKNRRKP
jgi:thioredoxin 1